MPQDKPHKTPLIALALSLGIVLLLFFLIKPEKRKNSNKAKAQTQAPIKIFNPELQTKLSEQAARFDLDDPNIMATDHPHGFQVGQELETTLPIPHIPINSSSLKKIPQIPARAQTFDAKIEAPHIAIQKNWPKTKLALATAPERQEKIIKSYTVTSTDNPFEKISFSDEEILAIKALGAQRLFTFLIRYSEQQIDIIPNKQSTNTQALTSLLHKIILQNTNKLKILGQKIPNQSFTISIRVH